MGNPTYLYRRKPDGEIEAKVFDSEDLPTRHWVDDPAKCAEKKTTRKKKEAE